MLKVAQKDAPSTVNFTYTCNDKANIQNTTKTKKHSDGYADRAAATSRENLTLISTICSEGTHPLVRFSLLGSTFRPLGQRHDEEGERIFARPPLPWHESRGTTGVKTPDNQSGILNFDKVKVQTKKSDSPVWRTPLTPSL